MRLIKYMITRIKPIAIAALAFAVLFFLYGFFNTYHSSSIVVSFIYPNSEKGQYPDLTRLNIFDFMSDEVIQKAVDKYNKEKGASLQPDDIKGHISVTEYVSPTLQEQVQSARSNGEDYSYFANEFTVTCGKMRKIDSHDWKHIFGLIPNIDSKLMIDMLYESYKEYFMNSHTEMNIIPRLASTIDTSYDYLETVNVFENRINMYIDYLEAKNSENGSFISKTTGMTFNDLIVEFQNLKNLRLESLKGYISASKIARNNESFINKLRAENENLNLSYQKAQSEADISHSAMNEYDHTFEENIVITGMNEEIGLYQARPKTAYDTITKRALKYGVEASTLRKDIEENERLIVLYRETYHSPEEAKRLRANIDSMISEIESSCYNLANDANKTVEDFLNEKSSDYLRRSDRQKNYFSLYILMRCGAAFVFGAFMMTILCIMYDLFMKRHAHQVAAIREKHTRARMLRSFSFVKKGQSLSEYVESEFSAARASRRTAPPPAVTPPPAENGAQSSEREDGAK